MSSADTEQHFPKACRKGRVTTKIHLSVGQVTVLLSEMITSGLFVYIWPVRVADVCVILVGDFTSWVMPGSVIVESQEECGFSKSVLTSPSTRISAWDLTIWMLSIICTKLSNHS